MSRTYEGTLKGDRIAWRRDAPATDRPLRVSVTVLEDEAEKVRRGHEMADALRSIANLGGFSEIHDPGTWQRESRADRRLPGRDD